MNEQLYLTESNLSLGELPETVGATYNGREGGLMFVLFLLMY